MSITKSKNPSFKSYRLWGALTKITIKGSCLFMFFVTVLSLITILVQVVEVGFSVVTSHGTLLLGLFSVLLWLISFGLSKWKDQLDRKHGINVGMDKVKLAIIIIATIYLNCSIFVFSQAVTNGYLLNALYIMTYLVAGGYIIYLNHLLRAVLRQTHLDLIKTKIESDR